MSDADDTAAKMAGLLVLATALVATGAYGQPPEESQRLVRAEAPIVAGNAVIAKQRALSDAFRQAAERAFDELLKEGIPMPQPLPTGVAQLKASLATSAQKFMRSYRLIEQQSEGGVLRVMVEADEDTVRLRKELERARGEAPQPTGAVAPAPVANFLLVAGSPPVAAMVVEAMGAAGARARLDTSAGESQLLVNAGKQNAYALFVSAASVREGWPRATGRMSVKCNLRTRLFRAGAAGLRGPMVDHTYQERGFAAEEPLARSACFEKVSGQAARGLVIALRAPTVAAAFVTVQLDLVDSGPVAVLLQALRRLGAVSASEVRHVSADQAEIRVFTRMGGVALGQALFREVAGRLTMEATQTTNDLLALRVRAPGSLPIEENH